MSHKITSTKADALSIKEAAEASGLSNVYIRRAILTGKLPSTKVQVGDTEVMRHEIAVEDFNAWRASTASRSRRDDGRGKYTVYASPEEYAEIVELLKEKELETPIGKANDRETIQPVV